MSACISIFVQCTKKSLFSFTADLEKAIKEFEKAATKLDATAQETDGE